MKRLIATLAGVVLAGGLALTPVVVAYAGGDHKEVICHPNGSPAGYSKVNVDKHSSHFDDDGTPKHEHDGRVDVYSDSEGRCPGEEPEPTETATETPTTQNPVPEDASYALVMQDATCTTPEGGTFTLTNANIVGSTDPWTFEGPHDGAVHIYADEGHAFPGGATEIDVPLVLGDVLPADVCEEPTDPPTTCPRVSAEADPCGQPDPNRPVRSFQCVGNDLVVTVEFPNGNIEHTPHNNSPACRSGDSTQRGVGTPRRTDAPSVTVVEEGM